MKPSESDIIKEDGQHSAPSQEIKKSIGNKIFQIRKKRKFSQEKVANKLGMSRIGLTHIENGDNNINAVQLWKLACILGCHPSDFFPPVPKGFTITGADYEKIVKEDEKVDGWAKDLFGDILK